MWRLGGVRGLEIFHSDGCIGRSDYESEFYSCLIIVCCVCALAILFDEHTYGNTEAVFNRSAELWFSGIYEKCTRRQRAKELWNSWSRC